jgi:hypothetical protein
VCVLPGRRTHRLAERCERWLGDATCTWRVQRRCDSAAVVVALPLHAADGIVHVRGSPASLSAPSGHRPSQPVSAVSSPQRMSSWRTRRIGA